MPFRSPKQERFMWANHPDIARRWTAEFGSVRGKGKDSGMANYSRLAAKMTGIKGHGNRGGVVGIKTRGGGGMVGVKGYRPRFSGPTRQAGALGGESHRPKPRLGGRGRRIPL